MGKYDDKEGLSIFDCLLICGAGLLIKSGIDKARERKEEEEKEYEEFIEKLKQDEEEQNRRTKINNARKSVVCNFEEGISLEEFNTIAKKVAKKIKRIKNIDIDNGNITCSVISQTGSTEWEFNVDFNDWGHISGTRWTYTENFDSSIPEHYGDSVADEIKCLLEEKEIEIKELSDEVDSNNLLGKSKSLSFFQKRSFLSKTFKKERLLKVKYKYEEMLGEHIYPVFSIFINSGFKNIKTIKNFDLDSNNLHLRNKVEKILVNGIEYKDYKNGLEENAEILIKIHERKKIKVPSNINVFKNKDHNEVKKQLKEMGFVQIKEEKIPDIIIGIFNKEGYVKDVLVDNKQIEPNKKYFFDKEITIIYHVNKF